MEEGNNALSFTQIDNIIFNIASTSQNFTSPINRETLYHLFVENDITQVISDSEIVLNKETINAYTGKRTKQLN